MTDLPRPCIVCGEPCQTGRCTEADDLGRGVDVRDFAGHRVDPLRLRWQVACHLGDRDQQ